MTCNQVDTPGNAHSQTSGGSAEHGSMSSPAPYPFPPLRQEWVYSDCFPSHSRREWKCQCQGQRGLGITAAAKAKTRKKNTLATPHVAWKDPAQRSGFEDLTRAPFFPSSFSFSLPFVLLPFLFWKNFTSLHGNLNVQMTSQGSVTYGYVTMKH